MPYPSIHGLAICLCNAIQRNGINWEKPRIRGREERLQLLELGP